MNAEHFENSGSQKGDTLLVAEKINSSRPRVAEAIEARNAEFIKSLARGQEAAGAHYIDVNAGTFLEAEADALCWLVETVQAETELPLCLDSPSPEALRRAMALHRDEPMINSISLEPDRFEPVMEVISERPCRVIALCMSATAMPTDSVARVEAADEIISRLADAEFPLEKIYVDPLIQPVSVDTSVGLAALAAIREIGERHPGVHTICGLSNISFGLPRRHLINRTFLILALAFGLSAAICDPTDSRFLAALRSAEMLLGKDEFCENYIDAFEKGILDN
jgi:5-methyltetrahydrofolate--homocysteine methyltransferase